MTDIRESVLARLVTVLGKVRGVNNCFRNAVNLSETRLPCIVVYDGDEVANENDPVRQNASPRRVTMTPEVTLAVMADPETVGKDLNTLRARIVSAVLSDSTLIALTGDNALGGIRYDGCATELHQGRNIQGIMSLRFSFTYVLRLSDL